MEIRTKRNREGSVLMNEKKNEIILFENQEVKLEVNLKDETVWLNLEQMAELFKRDKSVISRHISNIFKEEELEKIQLLQNLQQFKMKVAEPLQEILSTTI